MFTPELTITTMHIYYTLFLIISIIGKYEAETVMDRLIAFGMLWVLKASIIFRW